MSVRAFFDTNVLIYAVVRDDPRSLVAERLLTAGGIISVQVLNEFASVARRKLQMPWDDVVDALTAQRRLCEAPLTVDVQMHETACEVARTDGLNLYDALILAAAQRARCEVVYSEDLQHGRAIGSLRIENPFA